MIDFNMRKFYFIINIDDEFLRSNNQHAPGLREEFRLPVV